jgi:hypothetical protein
MYQQILRIDARNRQRRAAAEAAATVAAVMCAARGLVQGGAEGGGPQENDDQRPPDDSSARDQIQPQPPQQSVNPFGQQPTLEEQEASLPTRRPAFASPPPGRFVTPAGAVVTARLAQPLLAEFCAKLPGSDM